MQQLAIQHSPCPLKYRAPQEREITCRDWTNFGMAFCLDPCPTGRDCCLQRWYSRSYVSFKWMATTQRVLAREGTGGERVCRRALRKLCRTCAMGGGRGRCFQLHMAQRCVEYSLGTRRCDSMIVCVDDLGSKYGVMHPKIANLFNCSPAVSSNDHVLKFFKPICADHCRGEGSYDHATHQKLVETHTIPPSIAARSVSVAPDGSSVKVCSPFSPCVRDIFFHCRRLIVWMVSGHYFL